MELQLRKLGNSTGLTIPPSVLREHGLSAGQSVLVETTSEGYLMLIPKSKKLKFSAQALTAACNLKAPMPADLAQRAAMKPVGNECW
jgi:antitoxin ChpS